MAEFRFLDKDLDRIANAESAGLHSARPWQRAGVALSFAALATVLGAAAAGAGATGLLIAGVMVAAFLALSIGANDVANALGPAVGAGAVSMGLGLAAVAAAEVAGALFAGGQVNATLATGLLSAGSVLDGSSAAPATIMLAAMLAAALWIALATWAGAPVSTTHAVVGGIAGAGMALLGPAAPHWPEILRVATGWMVSPLLAGLAGAVLLAVLRRLIHHQPDRIAAAARWSPLIVSVVVAVLALQAIGAARPGAAVSVVTALAAGGGAWLLTRRRLRAELSAAEPSARNLLTRLFGPPLAVSAVLMGFAHGANDVANIAAPLGIIAHRAMPLGAHGPLVTATLALGGAGIALGALLFGRRLVRMVGSRITRLNPARALCVSLATSTTVLGASRLGLPVSTTHVAVGAVFGVGFWREWEERRLRGRQRRRQPLPPEERHRRRLVRRSALIRTLAAWAITVPAAGSLAAAIALLIG